MFNNTLYISTIFMLTFVRIFFSLYFSYFFGNKLTIPFSLPAQQFLVKADSFFSSIFFYIDEIFNFVQIFLFSNPIFFLSSYFMNSFKSLSSLSFISCKNPSIIEQTQDASIILSQQKMQSSTKEDSQRFSLRRATSASDLNGFRSYQSQIKLDFQQENPEKYFEKPKIRLICSCKQTKQQNQYQLIPPRFHPLKNEEWEWLQKHYLLYSKFGSINLKHQYIQRVKKALYIVEDQIKNENIQQSKKNSALKNIHFLLEKFNHLSSKKQSIKNFQFHTQKTYVFLLMISVFEVFSKNYNTYQRNKVRHVFQQIEKLSSQSVYSSVKVLRFLQNRDCVITRLVPMNQTRLDCQVSYHISNYLQKSHLEIQKSKINLIQISQQPKRRKVVNIMISGFCTEPNNKKYHWRKLLCHMADSQVYALQWESNNKSTMLKFMLSAPKQLLLGRKIEQISVENKNPFVKTFDLATKTGEIMAYVIHKMFPHQLINLIGHSLGAELTKSIIKKSIQLNGGKNINKVMLMAGSCDLIQLEKVLYGTQNTFTILNFQSQKDFILKKMLKLAKPNLNPIGLNDIDQNIKNHFIKNVDLSNKIDNHSGYYDNFQTMFQHMDLREQ